MSAVRIMPARPPLDAALRSLAARVARLAPSHRDPERFHEEKSEIAAELRRLANSTGRPEARVTP